MHHEFDACLLCTSLVALIECEVTPISPYVSTFGIPDPPVDREYR